MATDPNLGFEDLDETLGDMIDARHTEVETFEDLSKQRGTSIPALFNQLYKFVQNPSTISIETYKRMIDTDDTIGSGIAFLITCLAARMGRYAHPSPEITEFVNKALDNEIEGGWTNLLKDLLSAVWAGFYVGEIVWSNKDCGFVPQKIVNLPQSTIFFETERTGEVTRDGILQYQRNYNPYLTGNGFGYLGGGPVGFGFMGFDTARPDAFAKFGDLPFPLRTANSFNYLSIRIPRQKVVHYSFNDQGQAGNPYGRSMLRRAYKYYVTKDAILQMKLIALDRKGTPLNIVYVDPHAMVENQDADVTGDGNASNFRNNANAGQRADLAARAAFKNVHNDSTIVLPGKKGEIYDVQTVDQNPNTADFIQALDFCNKSILRALLLPSLIFGNGDGTGSFALGQEHAKTFDKICDSINAGLEHVILQQLVKPLIAYNYPRSAWEKDGIGGFTKRTLSRDEVGKEMEVVEKGVNMGAIDVNDLQDLNKIRDTMGYEPMTEEQFAKAQAEKEEAVQAAQVFGEEQGSDEPGESGASQDAPGEEKKSEQKKLSAHKSMEAWVRSLLNKWGLIK